MASSKFSKQVAHRASRKIPGSIKLLNAFASISQRNNLNHIIKMSNKWSIRLDEYKGVQTHDVTQNMYTRQCKDMPGQKSV